MSYKTVVSITITFTIAKKRKTFFQKTWNIKKVDSVRSVSLWNVFQLFKKFYLTGIEQPVILWLEGNMCLKSPKNLIFECYIYIVCFLYLEEILVLCLFSYFMCHCNKSIIHIYSTCNPFNSTPIEYKLCLVSYISISGWTGLWTVNY